jgi:hypothetical protein
MKPHLAAQIGGLMGRQYYGAHSFARRSLSWRRRQDDWPTPHPAREIFIKPLPAAPFFRIFIKPLILPPDAMEGPAITSALIHAATLVMAGILILIYFSELSRANESTLMRQWGPIHKNIFKKVLWRRLT